MKTVFSFLHPGLRSSCELSSIKVVIVSVCVCVTKANNLSNLVILAPILLNYICVCVCLFHANIFAGVEFRNYKMEDFVSKIGIKIEFSPSYSPWSNRLNERNH